jgi:acyl carrier protein
MPTTSVENVIRGFLLQLPAARKVHDLKPRDSLFQRGLLDSQGVINTVAFCEETFGIEIRDEEVVPENFESVRALSRLIKAGAVAIKLPSDLARPTTTDRRFETRAPSVQSRDASARDP